MTADATKINHVLRRAADGSGAAFNRSVHGARGLFAALVFCFHVANSGLSTFYSQDHWLAVWVFQSFKFGVELFFGISGFVILGALARAPSIRAFLWDRATRIYPLLWLTLLAITGIALATGRWRPDLGDWLLNFLAPPPLFPLQQVNPAAWSLGYEVTFYAVCAACWHSAARGWRWFPTAAIVGFGLLIFLPRAILIPAGVIIAAGWGSRSPLRRLAAVAPGLWLAPFLLLWRWLELNAPMHDIAQLTPTQVGPARWLVFLPTIAVAGIFGTLALDGIVQQAGTFSRILRTPLFQWLGTISYSFYLWHPVVMAATKSIMMTLGLVPLAGAGAQLIFASISLPPSLGIAHVSQRLVEKRLTRLLRRLGPCEASGAAPTTAVPHAMSAAPVVPYADPSGQARS